MNDYIKDKNPRIDIDSIEINSELRAILKDKEYRVIHDDFLTLHTYKHYDVIIMNPLPKTYKKLLQPLCFVSLSTRLLSQPLRETQCSATCIWYDAPETLLRSARSFSRLTYRYISIFSC